MQLKRWREMRQPISNLICPNCQGEEFEKVFLLLTRHRFPNDNMNLNIDACKDTDKTSIAFGECKDCECMFKLTDDNTIDISEYLDVDDMVDELGLEELKW